MSRLTSVSKWKEVKRRVHLSSWSECCVSVLHQWSFRSSSWSRSTKCNQKSDIYVWTNVWASFCTVRLRWGWLTSCSAGFAYIIILFSRIGAYPTHLDFSLNLQKKKKTTKTDSCGCLMEHRNQYFTPWLQPVAILPHVLLCLVSPSFHIKIKTNSSCVVCSWTHFVK